MLLLRRSPISSIKQTFEKLLAEFVSATAQSMEAARALSHIAIQQFEAEGDLSYAELFVNTMPANYLRRVAFLTWLGEHSPLKVESSKATAKGELTYKLSKDKAPDAQAFKVEVALMVDFWEYDPAPTNVNFGSEDVVKALKAAVKKFSKDRYHAASDKATIAVAHAKSMIDELEASLKTRSEPVNDVVEEDRIEVPAAESIPLSDDIPVQAHA